MGEAVELATRARMLAARAQAGQHAAQRTCSRQQPRQANGQADRFAHVQPPLPLCSMVLVWLPQRQPVMNTRSSPGRFGRHGAR